MRSLRPARRPAVAALSVAILAATASLGAQPAAAAGSATTTLVSVATSGQPANAPSIAAAVSTNGRYVVFATRATNLSPKSTNGEFQVFLRDRTAGTTTLVSIGMDGAVADGSSNSPDVSADGRYVAFSSAATNLVPGDTNDAADVFVRDLQARTTTRVSLDSAGGQLTEGSGDPAISDAGTRIAFLSSATAVPGDSGYDGKVYLRDTAAGTTIRASAATDPYGNAVHSFSPVISGDGSVVGYSQAEEYSEYGLTAAMAYEVSTGRRNDLGGSRVDSLSFDGRYAGLSNRYYCTHCANGGDAKVYDRQTGTYQTVSGAALSRAVADVSVSDDGRTAAWLGSRLYEDPREVMVWRDGRRFQADVDTSGAPVSAASDGTGLSGDGRLVVFGDEGSTLVSGDTNGVTDVFAYRVPPIAVDMTTPKQGARVIHQVAIAATAVPDSANPAAVTGMDFYRDGRLLGAGTRDPSAPGRYTLEWDASHFYGTHRLGARATDSDGHQVSPASISVQVAGDTALSSSVSPRSVTYGSPVTVAGRLSRFDGTPAAGEKVEVLCTPVGAAQRRVALVTTGPDGRVGFIDKPASGGSYVLHHGRSASYADSYSGYHSVSVRSKVAASLTPGRASVVTRPLVSGIVTPAHAGTTVQLQQRKKTVWRTVATAALNPSGAYAMRTPKTYSGRYHFRLVKPADADHTTGTSAEVVFTAYRVGISYIRANPPGSDSKHLNGEWATLKNVGKIRVDLRTWQVSNGSRSYALPSYKLGPGAKVRVHSGSGATNPGDIHLGLGRPLWPNSGATGRLYDWHGGLVGRYRY